MGHHRQWVVRTQQRLYALSRKAGAGDLVFMTGDSHSFWANRLADKAGRSAGIELGTAGISPGDFIESGFGEALSRRLDAAMAAHNPEVLWTDNMHQGYVRLELTHRGGEASFIAVDTVLSPQYRTFPIKRMAIARSGRTLGPTEKSG